jgi:anti-sigma regulatory factor (Ser/Thr protein kinase)
MGPMNTSLQAQQWVAIGHASDIASARRVGTRIAQNQGFDDVRCGQLAIVITEAATNILKHAGEGRISIFALHAGERRGVEVVALDQGPGIGNFGYALRDGVSSAGTAGNGLGAMSRLADSFDVYAPRGKGAVFCMRLWKEPRPEAPVNTGALCLPLAGEDESGDAWAIDEQRRFTTLLMADGLGHGPDAAKASQAALDRFALQPSLRPGQQVEACHAALRASRGAALAVAQFDAEREELSFSGVGNISACVIDGATRRQMVSHNGIVGHNIRKIQEFTIACAPGTLVVLHSDGIGTQWDLNQYPGLAGASPALVAAILLRDHARARDDACVLVHRIGAAP